MKTKTVFFVLGLLSALLVASPSPATAATSNTPVWIGAGYAGSYQDGTRPGQHSGNHVAFDFFQKAGTAVAIYAAPKNSAFNKQGHGPRRRRTRGQPSTGSRNDTASKCGYYARVEIRHSGNPIGMVSFHHLASRAPTKREISRWGGTVGKIAEVAAQFRRSPCYQVKHAQNRRALAYRVPELRLSSRLRPRLRGNVSIPAARYQGYIGDYGKAPLSGNRCPAGI